MLITATVEDITPQKLNALFELCGSTLPPLKSVRAVSLDGGNGYMAQSFRLHVEWEAEAGDAPSTLVAKLPQPRIFPDPPDDMRRMFRREAMFHREVAPGAPARTAHAYVSEIDADTGAAVLIFEDLGRFKAYSDDESLSFEQVQSCLSQLAALHARYWQSTELASMDWLGYPAETNVDEVPLADFRRGWPRLVASGAYDLSPAHLRLGDLLMERLDAVHDALHVAPETLIHTDLHQENLFFNGAEPTFIDWQLAERASGAKDVAKLTTSCLEPGKVASEQPRLIQHYFSELQRHGVTGYSMGELERDVHLATCHYVASLLFLDDDADFAALSGNVERTDFTSQRVLAASGRAEVIAAVEAL